ncbi:hypothetical protein JCM2421_07560 [Staphylococcus auricularis]|nr:hypothetical protein JCM2421_07560 [Staphylococcus auricularis]
MHIAKIDMVLRETLNCMNVMIVLTVTHKTMHENKFKEEQKIMKNYNWEYFQSSN